jgi:UDP-glucose 4-epimerase
MTASILVTGGTGYVGSHMVVALAQAGYQPVILDNHSNSTSAIVRGSRGSAAASALRRGRRARHHALVRALLRERQVQAVVHCAA